MTTTPDVPAEQPDDGLDEPTSYTSEQPSSSGEVQDAPPSDRDEDEQ